MTTNSSSTKSFHVAASITAINVLVASGFSLAGLISPQFILPATAIPNQASLVFAMYAAARTLPLAVTTLVLIYKRSTSALVVIGALAGTIQAIDAVIGLYQRDIGKTVGPLVLAVAQFVVLRSFINHKQ